MSSEASGSRWHVGTVHRMEHLGRVDIFSALGAQELLVLAERSEGVVFEPGQTIFREGAAAAEIYTIVTGRVELCREAGQVELLGPGKASAPSLPSCASRASSRRACSSRAAASS